MTWGAGEWGTNMKNTITILGHKLKRDKDMGSYFTTIEAEPYDTGKHHFRPKHRIIYVSGEMYPGTEKNFIYITSEIMGELRLYRHRYWYSTGMGNIFASGKTLDEAIEEFSYNLKHKIYNRQ